jgi:DegV family protein with EDD domain
VPKQVAIITDSTSDIPADLAAEHDIHVVPLYIHFGDETLRDGVDIDSEGFFRRLTTDPHHPKSSQPTPADFEVAFNKIRGETSAEEIVVIAISSALSGSYQSAMVAKGEVDFPVHVLDTRNVSMGETLIVLAAAEAAEGGANAAEVMDVARSLVPKVRLYFAVDTLEFLHKGGRIGAASKFIGTALSIKPLLHIHDGHVAPLERIRTKKRALARLLDLVEENHDPNRPIIATIGHGQAQDEADGVAQEFQARFQPEKLYRIEVGAAIGTHAGPGVVGAGFYQK